MLKFNIQFLKILNWFVIGIVVAFGLIAIIFWLNYTDVNITEGQGYGFSIGQSKQQTFKAAKIKYHGTDVYILYPLDKNKYGPHKKLKFNDHDYIRIQDRNNWAFYFNTDDYFNVLRLAFDNENKLKSIYRHKQLFELP